MKFKFNPENTFFTSDTHFNHAHIIRFCTRPFTDVNQMNEALIRNWNRVVGQNDVIFHLGDFCFGGKAAWNSILDRLNGRIFLILGNHDLKNYRPDLASRFEHVTMQMHIEVGKQEIYLNHNPFLCYGGAYDNTWQLFGHVHTGPHNTGIDIPRLKMLFPLQYDVGVDNNAFAPVSFNRVRDLINEQVSNAANSQ